MISDTKTAAPERLDLAGVVWSCIRAPILAVLVLFEPIVGFVLYALAILGLLTTLLFRFVGVGARFPFWTMLGISLSFALAHLAYHLVIQVIAGSK
jgi:hypothetical protein